MKQHTGDTPRVAIVDNNTLSAIGLRQMLQHVMPIIEVETFGSMAELEANHPERFVHYFVQMSIVLSNRAFFSERRNKTIVLTTSADPDKHPVEFHSLCTALPEQQLVRALLMLEQHAHGTGKNLPPMPQKTQDKLLTDREIEVLSLLVQGYINKSIADRLNISLTTVITHRKNISAKLHTKSIATMTIYAVMHGYVDINLVKG